MIEAEANLSELGPLVLHRMAEERMGEIDIAHSRGDLDAAKALSVEAASFEILAFTLIPETNVRTRNIIGVSAVTLNRNGEAYEAVLSTADQVLDSLGENAFPGTVADIQGMASQARAKLGSAIGNEPPKSLRERIASLTVSPEDSWGEGF